MEAFRREHPAETHHLLVVVTCRTWRLITERIDDLPSMRFFKNAARLVVDAFNATEVDTVSRLLGAQANSRDIVVVVDDRPAIITTTDGEIFSVVLLYRAQQNLFDRGLLRADAS